jgi:pimeloyl-ACP methyl ester carboxylesterase
MVRGFLLQSLVRDGTTGWRWRLNLPLLARDLGELRGFPDPPPGAVFERPVLWIAGASSTYVLEEDRARMAELFPAVRLVRVKHAGHWVHSEQPEAFVSALRVFLGAPTG